MLTGSQDCASMPYLQAASFAFLESPVVFHCVRSASETFPYVPSSHWNGFIGQKRLKEATKTWLPMLRSNHMQHTKGYQAFMPDLVSFRRYELRRSHFCRRSP